MRSQLLPEQAIFITLTWYQWYGNYTKLKFYAIHIN